ncbi:hypothetical protein SAMN05216436_11330 [bacterium A37T11]|nr:hypothetical protein SAMN05216436_11330 [bacterium A37T11]
MRTPKLISNYDYLTDAELASLATRVTDAMRTNTNFPDLNPPFADYEAAALDYIAKQGITANRNASAQQKKEKDEAREVLIVMMRKVSSYINNLTDVSSVQLSSGFLPVADPKSLGNPSAPAWSRLRLSSRPAEILLDFPAVPGAYDYELQIAWETDANNQLIWLSAGTNSSSRGNFYAPVKDGVRYYFRVRARNRRGMSGWSPVSSLIAQVDA